MKKALAKFKQDLLFGTSHMIPFIVAGGVLLSLAVMLSGKGAVPETGILNAFAWRLTVYRQPRVFIVYCADYQGI